jgi:hypothetical protein
LSNGNGYFICKLRHRVSAIIKAKFPIRKDETIIVGRVRHLH